VRADAALRRLRHGPGVHGGRHLLPAGHVRRGGLRLLGLGRLRRNAELPSVRTPVAILRDFANRASL
jgi:hypothetical protein